MTRGYCSAQDIFSHIGGGRLGDPMRSLTANGSLLAWRICQHRMRAILSLGPRSSAHKTFRRAAAARLAEEQTALQSSLSFGLDRSRAEAVHSDRSPLDILSRSPLAPAR
jgi:hypothetical protein